jgi:hypothetical protein
MFPPLSLTSSQKFSRTSWEEYWDLWKRNNSRMGKLYNGGEVITLLSRTCSTHGEIRNSYKLLVRNITWKDHLGNLDVDGKLIVKFIFNKYGFSVVYFTMLSISQAMWLQCYDDVWDCELEGIWKEAAVALSKSYLGIWFEGLRKTV